MIFHALSYGGAFPHALSYGICPLSYLCHIYLLLQSLSSPYSSPDWIIEYMELTSQDFRLSGFLCHVSNTAGAPRPGPQRRPGAVAVVSRPGRRRTEHTGGTARPQSGRDRWRGDAVDRRRSRSAAGLRPPSASGAAAVPPGLSPMDTQHGAPSCAS